MCFVHRHLLAGCLLFAACSSTVPSPEQFEVVERQVRALHQSDFENLERQRQTGKLDAESHRLALAELDHRIRNEVDNRLWNRHALAQSELRANNIPTPDRPVSNPPPGVGSMPNSLYNSQRQSGMGSQLMGNFLRDSGGANFNTTRAGTTYDP
jgi:hypothetical protein